MNCIVHPALDATYFQNQVDFVSERLEVDGLSVTPLILPQKEGCAVVAKRAGIDPADVKSVCEGGHSASISASEGQYIVIMADRPFLSEDPDAARGLLSHEIMHSVQRRSGLEETIEKAGIALAEDVVDRLPSQGVSQDEADWFIQSVVSTAILCCKDLYANTAVINSGLAKELSKYYSESLGGSFCPMPDKYDSEETVDDVVARIKFELQLVPAWLPFDSMAGDLGDELRGRIRECYKQHLAETSECMNRIKDVYATYFSEHESFNREFFETVLDCSIHVVEDRVLD